MANVDWNALRDRAYKCACDHGFHEQKANGSDRVGHLMLILTEISEVVEADRKGKHAFMKDFHIAYNKATDSGFRKAFERYIKDSKEDEFADIIIRCLDLAGAYYLDDLIDFDLHVYDPHVYDHEYFMSQSFCESAFELCKIVMDGSDLDLSLLDLTIDEIISYVLNWCDALGIDIMAYVELKMEYNETRPYKNGKKY